MAKILVLYGTIEGQTAKIAEHIGKTLAAQSHEVEALNGERLPGDFELDDFDAVIIGAPVYYGGYPKHIRDLIQQHLDALRRKPAAFFSVSGAAGSPHEKDQAAVRKNVEKFLAQTGWRPTQTGIFGGAIVYTRYGFFKRLMMKSILKSAGGPTDTSRDYEFTDWETVTRFAETFARTVSEEKIR